MTEVKKKTSIYIALPIPKVIAEMIAQPGGEPAEKLHITLCFIGKYEEIDEKLVTDLKAHLFKVAPWLSKTLYSFNNIGRFNFGKNPHVVYAEVVSENLAFFREAVKSSLEMAGFPVDKKYKDFKPHITLCTVQPSEPTPLRNFR